MGLHTIKLSKISTDPPAKLDKEKASLQTANWCQRIADFQYALYAEKKQSLLVILQGMDGSGKDGVVKNVFGKCTATGLAVSEFKKPTDEELAHDFLWRVHKVAPEKGSIRIFVRSHYEDVLIQRVHNLITPERAQKRMEAINHFEELLRFDNNTVIIKFYMHISHKQQKIELQQRIDDVTKQWKYNPADWEESKLWKKYMACYEDAINQSSIPWHIIPTDKRWYRDYLVAKIVYETMEKMNPILPTLKPDENRKAP